MSAAMTSVKENGLIYNQFESSIFWPFDIWLEVEQNELLPLVLV